jgi:hypothetical protein
VLVGIGLAIYPRPYAEDAVNAVATVRGSIPEGSYSVGTPKCPEGWNLVYIGRPMCSKELREPE